MLELRHLRTLLALYESGSLTAAARRLHLTQSALSHQLRELEERLALPLVTRGQRPLGLTKAGQHLLALAQTLLPQVDDTLDTLRRLAKGEVGRLHIASECHSCLDWLLPRLRELRRRFPGVDVDVALSASLDPLPRLLDGHLDLVLTPDRREMPGLAWVELFGYPVMLIMAPEHPLAARTKVDAADLVGETLLTYPVARERLDIFTRVLWPAGIEPARVRAAESTAMLVELAALGLGVTALPQWAVEHMVQAGEVAARPLGIEATLHAAMPEAHAAWPYVVECIGLLREQGTTHDTKKS